MPFNTQVLVEELKRLMRYFQALSMLTAAK